jgi:hypothetical protein
VNVDKQFYAFKGDSFDKGYYLIYRRGGFSITKKINKIRYYFSYLNLLQYCKVQQEAPFQATVIIFIKLYTA